MTRIRLLLSRLDRFQQRTAWLAFPLAVVKKFGDDNAGSLAAVLAWSAMAAVFPLLLVLVTVLALVLHNDPSLQHKILNSALAEFPVIGPQLKNNINSMQGAGVGLAIGVIGTFLGARGVASAAQNAMNTVWQVPRYHRPGFPWSALRSVALMTVFGVGFIVTTALSGLGGGNGTLGGWSRVAAIAIAFALNVALFAVVFRLATSKVVRWRNMWVGAFLTAAVWEILLTVGGFLVAHNVRHMSSVYGTFAIVLGLMSWLYLQAQLTLYAVEVDVVRARGYWPRTFFGDSRTAVDEAAYAAYLRAEERHPEERVRVDFVASPDCTPAGAEAAKPMPYPVEPERRAAPARHRGR